MSSLLDAVYATTTEPDGWAQLIDEISHQFNGQCFLYLRPPNDAGRTRLMAANLDPQFVASHNAYYNTINSLVLSRPEARASALPVMTVEEAVPQEELQRGEFFADWMRPQDFQHGVRVQIGAPDTKGLMLGVLRSSRFGMVTDDEAELMRRLVPHLERAVSIASHLGALEARAEVSLSALERLGLSAFIVDGQRRVKYMNVRAEQLAQANESVLVRHGMLFLHEKQYDARLRQGLAAATGWARADEARSGSSLRLPSLEPVSISISPLRETSLAMPGSTPLALVLVGHPTQRTTPSEAALREAYGLTPAEARLATALVAGKTLQAYAHDSRSSLATVKTHLRSVFAKTGEDRQSDVIRRILSDPLLRLD